MMKVVLFRGGQIFGCEVAAHVLPKPKTLTSQALSAFENFIAAVDVVNSLTKLQDMKDLDGNKQQDRKEKNTGEISKISPIPTLPLACHIC